MNTAIKQNKIEVEETKGKVVDIYPNVPRDRKKEVKTATLGHTTGCLDQYPVSKSSQQKLSERNISLG